MAPPDPYTPRERAVLSRLTSPAKIQGFLDSLRYSDDGRYRCPRSVLRDRQAHCYDGALLAAAALRRLGHDPVLVDLRAVRDDDHVIALFRSHGLLGAVAKSNFVGLRYREPIHRNLRELVLSYFEAYYNLEKEKTLRAYSRPVRLAPLDRLEWQVRDAAMDEIAARLDAARHYPLLPRGGARRLVAVDERSYRAGQLGINLAGVYRAPKEA
jgi:hypothetical protein